MMKALAAMRGPLSFTAVEFSKCQHQTVVDLVDLVGMESPGDRANKAIQVVPDPVFRAAKTTRGLLVRVAMTTARHVPGGMMIVLGSVVMMTVRRVLVVMTDRLAHVQLPSRRPMRFAIGVAVAA
ncbi:MAG: hypothetical protein ACO321_01120 [Ilumatobacteraceae bacterium]